MNVLLTETVDKDTCARITNVLKKKILVARDPVVQELLVELDPITMLSVNVFQDLFPSPTQ